MGYGFDTISRPKTGETQVYGQPRQQVLITAYHSDKRYFPKKTFFGAVLVTIPIIFSLLLLFSSMTANTYANGDIKSENTFYTINIPDNLEPKELIKDNIQPIKLVSQQQIAEEKRKTEEAYIAAKIALQVTRNGGFDDVYAQAEKKYGVPRQILAAVHYVETGQSGDTIRASSAGAVGPMQFKTNTFNAYAQDGDGDGIKSVYDVHDAIFTAAKHLAVNGASRGNITGALYIYNHSLSYVNRVLAIAKSLGYSL